MLEKIFVPVPGRYEMLDPVDQPTLEELTYIDGEGTTHRLEESLVLPDAPGYTVVVGPSPVDGAAANVLLTVQP